MIRALQPGDLPHVLEILAHWNMLPRPASAETPVVENTGLDPDKTLVALEAGDVVGVASWVSLDGGRAETTSFAVHPAWQGKGIGERLHRARLAAMKAAGIRQVESQVDRPERLAWYLRKFPYRVKGTIPKLHAFCDPAIAEWTVLILDL